MKKLLLIFCFLNAVVFGSELSLRDKLAEAKPGSYIVIEQSKNYTFLHIHSRQDRSIIIEEVTIPAARYARNPLPWQQWFECDAPGHTSWTMSQINLQSGRFEEMFSFTHQGWIDISASDAFLTTLLNLNFSSVPEERRRRVGLPPGCNRPDYRPLWNPRLVVNGQRISHVPFSVWRARWPSDRTELSRKMVEIYLPYEINDPAIPDYPTYFPYWIEVEGKIGSAKVRIIDSGVDAHSPKPSLPLRPPELIGDGKIEDGGLVLHIKTPSYYNEFIIVAQEASFFGKSFPLPCKATELEEGSVTLFVQNEELEKLMTPGETYRFLISPKEDPDVCLETRTPLEFIR